MERKEKRIGKVVHYFRKIKVAVVKLKEGLSVGDTILLRGGEREFTQKVSSIEREYRKLKRAKPKSEVGVKVRKNVREGDLVYKVPKKTSSSRTASSRTKKRAHVRKKRTSS